MTEVSCQVTRVATQQTVYVKIEGAPDRARWGGYTGMPVRPEQVVVTYLNGERGSVSVCGPLVTKTGKPRKDSWTSDAMGSNPPEWLLTLLAQLDEVYAREHQLVAVQELIVGDVVVPWNPAEVEVFGVETVTSPPERVPRPSYGGPPGADWVVQTDRGQIARRVGDDAQRVKIQRRK